MQLHRSEDCIARLNGDEFAIMISKVDKDNLHTVLKRIMQSLSQPFMIDNQERFLSFSMGASVYGWHSHNAEGLLRQANIARINAKHLGGHGFKVFESHMDNLSSTGFELENDLRKSLANNQIEVYYQPVVDARTYDIIGVEALLRWHHLTEGFISPAIFITLAETIGYIHELSQFVMSEAIKDCASWHAMGYPISVAINLSTRQFNESLLIAETHRLIERYQLAPEFINLEITENLAMSNGEQTVSILKGLKALGVKIAIDDFGTGYSSLTYLHRFPIDTLKVDRSFVRAIDQKEGQAVAKTIVALAKSLELKTVAEGIETKEQIEFMQSLDCDYFQGFIFAKPMPQNDLIEFLKNDDKRVKSF
jgi:EAL domain-containing protein (putative c-di-GMP-specific phosphodiesterase class I)